MSDKEQESYAGIITMLIGVVVVVIGVVVGSIIKDNLIFVFSAIGGLIITALGAILMELESQTELFIAYVEDFVKPKQKTKKKKKTNKTEK